MTIYLVRHTTPNIDKGICYGQADIDVTASFKEESKLILEKLENQPIENTISSPLQRCTKLAHVIDTNFTTAEQLKELDFGDWELKKWDDIPKLQLDPWMENYVNTAVTNGESYVNLYTRVISFYNNLQRNNSVLVTHAGVIRSILAYTTNTHLKNSFDFKIPYGAVVKINTTSSTYTYL